MGVSSNMSSNGPQFISDNSNLDAGGHKIHTKLPDFTKRQSVNLSESVKTGEPVEGSNPELSDVAAHVDTAQSQVDPLFPKPSDQAEVQMHEVLGAEVVLREVTLTPEDFERTMNQIMNSVLAPEDKLAVLNNIGNKIAKYAAEGLLTQDEKVELREKLLDMMTAIQFGHFSAPEPQVEAAAPETGPERKSLTPAEFETMISNISKAHIDSEQKIYALSDLLNKVVQDTISQTLTKSESEGLVQQINREVAALGQTSQAPATESTAKSERVGFREALAHAKSSVKGRIARIFSSIVAKAGDNSRSRASSVATPPSPQADSHILESEPVVTQQATPPSGRPTLSRAGSEKHDAMPPADSDPEIPEQASEPVVTQQGTPPAGGLRPQSKPLPPIPTNVSNDAPTESAPRPRRPLPPTPSSSPRPTGPLSNEAFADALKNGVKLKKVDPAAGKPAAPVNPIHESITERRRAIDGEGDGEDDDTKADWEE